jgi:hypothetical protein
VGKPSLLTLLLPRCRAGRSAARRGSLSGRISSCWISARLLHHQKQQQQPMGISGAWICITHEMAGCWVLYTLL